MDYLVDACKTSDVDKPYPYAYPPRFVLEVSARYAKQHSTLELTFTGAKRDLYTQIQLHPQRCKFSFSITWHNTGNIILAIIPIEGEYDLNEINSTTRDDAQRPTELSVPLPFPNGY